MKAAIILFAGFVCVLKSVSFAQDVNQTENQTANQTGVAGGISASMSIPVTEFNAPPKEGNN
jgi:hypothetical protein